MSKEKISILPIYIQLITKNNIPTIVLRTSTSNNELMKIIINAAFKNQPLILMPQFRNKIKSISTLIDKGIIYRNEEGELTYTF